MHLYLHVPFCARRCSYCDFAIAVRRDVPSESYVRAVLREWEAWPGHESWVGSEGVNTIYFGGGTPSRLDPRGLATILERSLSGLPADQIARIDSSIVERIFRQNISMGKGMGLMSMVEAVRALARAGSR